MNNSDSNFSNKKSAGKGNGNSVINNTEKPGDYVSGESAPSSVKHKFSTTQGQSNKGK